MPRFRHLPSHLLASGTVLLALVVGCGGEPGEGPPQATAGAAAAPADGTPASLRPQQGVAWVIFGTDTVRAEVADTPEARERGLMYRTELADGEGMIFVYSAAATRSFWMRNTFIPLDIAFLDDRLIVVDIQQMEPESETLHESAAPAMFALEVPQGWFASRGIEVGAEARIVFGRR
jgi:uncharacterized protein